MFIMEDIEIDSLVKKFKMLRRVGYDATLNLETTENKLGLSLAKLSIAELMS